MTMRAKPGCDCERCIRLLAERARARAKVDAASEALGLKPASTTDLRIRRSEGVTFKMSEADDYTAAMAAAHSDELPSDRELTETITKAVEGIARRGIFEPMVMVPKEDAPRAHIERCGFTWEIQVQRGTWDVEVWVAAARVVGEDLGDARFPFIRETLGGEDALKLDRGRAYELMLPVIEERIDEWAAEVVEHADRIRRAVAR
jgi:hypothetical protein